MEQVITFFSLIFFKSSIAFLLLFFYFETNFGRSNCSSVDLLRENNIMGEVAHASIAFCQFLVSANVLVGI